MQAQKESNIPMMMHIAMRDLLARHRARAITMSCLGMGLIDRGMWHPCLGFARFKRGLLGAVCLAGIKFAMTS